MLVNNNCWKDFHMAHPQQTVRCLFYTFSTVNGTLDKLFLILINKSYLPLYLLTKVVSLYTMRLQEHFIHNFHIQLEISKNINKKSLGYIYLFINKQNSEQ